ncbi:MAG: flagellar protein FlaG [Clostridium thermopalmarium]|uniref:flagellar protein FlaG n=1 Tax=Clostridium thermopalmarium TaxID=29373 RepID=UPI0023536148|nr:flagellar protein FlaG [Clostridium thermopalmarium]MBE6044697.1 flagellar protein FlaG [Clostridium thermopalmarium]
MSVNVLSQGGQINTSTISSNENFINKSEVINQQVNLPATEKQKSLREMNHGNEKDIKRAVDKLNKFLQGEATHIEYERHDKFKNQFVIKIINNDTKEVIREIPPKKILDMVAEMCKIAGIIVDEKA